MSATVDLGPAARAMAEVADGIGGHQLPFPTPCGGYSVGDLLDHVMGLTLAFRRAAEKSFAASDGELPEPSAANLPADWRDRLAGRLDDLVVAWRDPAAWEGTTAAGGLEFPAAEAGVVALNELVLHGWDLARATGQPFGCDPVSAEACLAFASAVPDDPQAREGLFGPVVRVPDDAPVLDRALGLSGRDPAWAPR